MARFTLPRDIYFGENAMENLKNLSGKKARIKEKKMNLVKEENA